MRCDYCFDPAIVAVRRPERPDDESYYYCAFHHAHGVNERLGWIVRRLDED